MIPENPQSAGRSRHEYEAQLPFRLGFGKKDGHWWPPVEVDYRMRIPEMHWFYEPQPAEFLFARRLLNYPDLFERDDLYGPPSLARVIEAFGLDLPARVPPRHREDSLENPQHTRDEERGIIIARGFRTAGSAAVAGWKETKYHQREVEAQTSFVLEGNIAQGYNMNGPTVIPARADFMTDVIYRDPAVMAVNGEEAVLYTETVMNTFYENPAGKRVRQGWYVILAPQTGIATVTRLSDEGETSSIQIAS